MARMTVGGGAHIQVSNHSQDHTHSSDYNCENVCESLRDEHASPSDLRNYLEKVASTVASSSNQFVTARNSSAHWTCTHCPLCSLQSASEWISPLETRQNTGHWADRDMLFKKKLAEKHFQ